jgi:hypothetical protein
MYSLCHALDVQISLSPTVSVRVTAAAAAMIAALVTLRSEKRVRMCVNTLRRTRSWKRMLTQSGTQQRCARPRGVCRPKQQCNKPSATRPQNPNVDGRCSCSHQTPHCNQPPDQVSGSDAMHNTVQARQQQPSFKADWCELFIAIRIQCTTLAAALAAATHHPAECPSPSMYCCTACK